MTELTTDRTWISIGALARASGVPAATLRNWERRYGFPLPSRKPSGHRLYPLDEVAHLRRLGELVLQGHRVGDLIHATEEELRSLTSDLPSRPAPARPSSPSPNSPGLETATMLSVDPSADLNAALAAAVALNGPELSRQLLLAWARYGPIGFLDRFLGPLLRVVGDAWNAGELRIHHEHFLTAQIGDLLRTVRLPLDQSARGPLVVLATLPGEEHGLGLEMAAVAFASSGWRCRYLGTQVPEEEIAAAAGDDADAVALSISRINGGPQTAHRIRRVRSLLPSRVTLLAGGEGAPPETGTQLFQDFTSLARWAETRVSAT